MATAAELDRAAWIRDGYLVVRDVLPAAELVGLREAAEAVCAAASQTDGSVQLDPTSALLCAPELAPSVCRLAELAADPKLLGAAEFLLGAEGHTALYQLLLVRSPPVPLPPPPPPGGNMGTDPRHWHRDHRPDRSGPLSLLQADLAANGPAHCQWNLALYPDSVFEVVPGSHFRQATAEEATALRSDGGTAHPLPGSTAVSLGAGDTAALCVTQAPHASQFCTGASGFTEHSTHHRG